MRAILILFSCFFIIHFSSSTELPSIFKKCNRKQSDFEQCLINATQDAVKQLDKPIPEFGLPSLEPYHFPAITISRGLGLVQFEQTYTYINVTGFTDTICSKFQINFEEKTMDVEFLFPLLKAKAGYYCEGDLLLYTVRGRGTVYLDFENLRYTITTKFEEYQNEGDNYIKIIDSNLDMIPEGIKLSFDDSSTFSEDDPLLNDIVKELITNRGLEAWMDGRSKYEPMYAKIFVESFNNLLAKVPVSEIFGFAT